MPVDDEIPFKLNVGFELLDIKLLVPTLFTFINVEGKLLVISILLPAEDNVMPVDDDKPFNKKLGETLLDINEFTTPEALFNVVVSINGILSAYNLVINSWLSVKTVFNVLNGIFAVKFNSVKLSDILLSLALVPAGFDIFNNLFVVAGKVPLYNIPDKGGAGFEVQNTPPVPSVLNTSPKIPKSGGL